MSKTVFAEESLKKYLQDLAPDSDGYLVGLILGQRSAQRDYVIHLPAFQILQTKTEGADAEVAEVSNLQVFKTLQDVNTKGFVLFAKQVAAFLSGGMWILGVYSAGPVDSGLLDSTQAPKLQTFMSSLFTKLATNQFLNGSNTPTPEKLVMHFNTSANKVTCKSVNIGDTKWYLSNTDWKFQAQPIKWQEVENRFAFDFKIPVEEKDGVTSLKFNLELLLKDQANVIKNAHCFLHGEVRDPTTTLDSIQLENSGDHEFGDHSIHAELEINCTEAEDESKVEYLKCSGDLVMSGHVYSRIYMQPRSTVEDAINALKEDIIRSLHTRFELHTDALIDEEEGSPEERVVQHDLPRRILLPLPSSEVKLSHYLFPGENASDSMASVQQILGITVDQDYVEEGLEEEADPELMLPILPSEEIDLSNPATPQPIPETSSSLYLTLSCLMLLVALCLGLFFMKDEDDTNPEMKKFPK